MKRGPQKFTPNVGRFDYQPITYRDPPEGTDMRHVSDQGIIEQSAGRAFDRLAAAWEMGHRARKPVRVFQACVQINKYGQGSVGAGVFDGSPDGPTRDEFIEECLAAWREGFVEQQQAA